jgi:pimeloyl-ACP methyl ester carboxylesterase
VGTLRERHIIELFPKAEIVTIEDAGHAYALQQPEAFAEVVGRLMADAP